MSSPRTWRNLVVAVVVALAVGATAAPVGAQAPPPTSAPVLARDAEAGPSGTLATTTLGLGATASTSRSAATRLAPGWTTVVAVPAGTQQVGLTWAGDPQAQFEVRTRTSSAAAAWSAPLGLEGEVDEAPDGSGGRPGAGPLWLGDAGVAEVQVRLAYGVVSDVRLDAMAWHAAGATSAARAAAISIAKPATPAGGPPLRLRSSWAPGGWVTGNSGCGTGPTVNPTLLHAVVHHTETPNSYAQADVPGILAGIYRFHTQSRGWCDIAYNFFVDRFGGVWEGRLGGVDEASRGGHALGFNDHSVGVALIGQHEPGGDFAVAAPTAVELTSLRDLLAWKLGSQGIDPTATVPVTSSGNQRYAAGQVVSLPTVGGHGDNGYSSCPGELVRTRLPQLRLDVAARIAATNNADQWRPHVTGARYFRQFLTDAEGSVKAPSRIGSYTSRVVRAGAAQGELTATIVFSKATQDRIGLVDRFYRVAFGREPDTTGLRQNVAHRDAGVLAVDLAGNYLRSAEFKARWGTLGDSAYVRLLYRNALHREGSAADVARWADKLAHGTTRQQALVDFAQSAEAQRKVDPQTRSTIAAFTMLRRVPTAAERSSWEPALAAGTMSNRDLVVALLRSPQYLARF
ncbi:DUF4214 domain-containing protein [Aquihabitans sp. G128]|uniref:DUF4214 domain-containing protein n=1 Tax=Aquihabitans sp. G128 TaxID=2849779 RepID=UPI001C233AC0|nr:DUF4214 domain-containing protein [Aquihabitans sp. G128]QXC62968.1 DUF4214 domain-containing protein [Aquihabitans sp. G128]